MSSPIRAILLDIEGTTTAIDFVTKTLFPYARERMAAFLREEGARPEVVAALAMLAKERAAEAGAFPGGDDVAYLHWLMDQDRKSPALKTLQGLIWEQGYADGSLRAHVYPDVPSAFRRWKDGSLSIYIYSSGSVLAQKLLFRHSIAGDLTPWIDGYFDTGVGAKRESPSYGAIAERIGVAPGAVLFLSDVEAELEAAEGAGMGSLLTIRNSVIPRHRRSARTFDDVDELFTS